MKILLPLLALLLPGFLFEFIPPVFAQSSTACAVIDIGTMSGPTPPIPPECEGIVDTPADCQGQTGYICAYKTILAYKSICSPYGPRAGGFHRGVDLCAPANTPIHALEDGVAVQSEYDHGCGNIVKTYDPAHRRHTLNCHMIRPGIAKNSPLKGGTTIIGYVGHTGANTSPTDHLHFQINSPGAGQYSGWMDPKVALAKWPSY